MYVKTTTPRAAWAELEQESAKQLNRDGVIELDGEGRTYLSEWAEPTVELRGVVEPRGHGGGHS